MKIEGACYPVISVCPFKLLNTKMFYNADETAQDNQTTDQSLSTLLFYTSLYTNQN